MTAEPLVVITGASGYLGQRLVPLAARRARVVGVHWRSAAIPAPGEPLRLDLTDRDATIAALGKLAPAAIIHAAAANPGASLDRFDPDNVESARNVAQAAAALANCRLVHVSTDVVHDGKHAPYADDALPAPLSVYGRAKAHAESVVLGEAPGAVAVRTSLIYGLATVDRGTQVFLDRLARGETVQLFADVVRQPVWIDALAEALITLALDLTQVSGPLNVAGDQPLTRAEYGRKLLAWWGVDGGDAVQDSSAAHLPDVPLDLRLELGLARSLGLAVPGFDAVAQRHPRPN